MIDRNSNDVTAFLLNRTLTFILTITSVTACATVPHPKGIQLGDIDFGITSVSEFNFRNVPSARTVAAIAFNARKLGSCEAVQEKYSDSVVELTVIDNKEQIVAHKLAPLSEWVWSYSSADKLSNEEWDIFYECVVYSESTYFTPHKSTSYSMQVKVKPKEIEKKSPATKAVLISLESTF